MASENTHAATTALFLPSNARHYSNRLVQMLARTPSFWRHMATVSAAIDGQGTFVKTSRDSDIMVLDQFGDVSTNASYLIADRQDITCTIVLNSYRNGVAFLLEGQGDNLLRNNAILFFSQLG
jgi:hypothetical protein